MIWITTFIPNTIYMLSCLILCRDKGKGNKKIILTSWLKLKINSGFFLDSSYYYITLNLMILKIKVKFLPLPFSNIPEFWTLEWYKYKTTIYHEQDYFLIIWKKSASLIYFVYTSKKLNCFNKVHYQ